MPQTRNLNGGDPYFELRGPDLEPTGWEWEAASADQRAEYWKLAAVRFGTAWDAMMASGIGVDGRPLRPVQPRRQMPHPGTKPGKRFNDEQAARYGRDVRRQDGPPLTPHRLASRARRWARMKPIEGGGVRGYWVASWGEIMGYHAMGLAGTGRKGQVTGIIRDIVGIAPSFLAKAKQQSVADWQRTAGDTIRRMASQMLTRLAMLREELADMFDAEAAETEKLQPNLDRIVAIRRRREQLGQMIYRLEVDPIVVAKRGTSAPLPILTPRVRPAVLRPGESRVLIRRTTRDAMRGG